MKKNFAVASLILALFALPAAAFPGQTLEDFLIKNEGFRKTGGLFEPRLPNFKFEVWENTWSKEFPFTKYFLSCDPLDQKGYVYLPKCTLIVKIEKGKQPIIICENQSILVGGQEQTDEAFKSVESMVEASYKPVTFQEKFSEFIRSFSKEPLLKPLVANGSIYVYRATYAQGRGSIVLMTPDFDSLPETIPKGTRVGGVVKKITYATAYEKMCLGVLADYLAAMTKKEKK
ncbi:MAG TPA: hypothetical protein DD435_09670 [Cyanobacteria bacterium UBA8530]|nr:hypothetical protein [Cyanobacteria bacterium UBA8530]